MNEGEMRHKKKQSFEAEVAVSAETSATVINNCRELWKTILIEYLCIR